MIEFHIQQIPMYASPTIAPPTGPSRMSPNLRHIRTNPLLLKSNQPGNLNAKDATSAARRAGS